MRKQRSVAGATKKDTAKVEQRAPGVGELPLSFWLGRRNPE
jgi:hypothetical protein